MTLVSASTQAAKRASLPCWERLAIVVIRRCGAGPSYRLQGRIPQRLSDSVRLASPPMRKRRSGRLGSGAGSMRVSRFRRALARGALPPNSSRHKGRVGLLTGVDHLLGELAQDHTPPVKSV